MTVNVAAARADCCFEVVITGGMIPGSVMHPQRAVCLFCTDGRGMSITEEQVARQVAHLVPLGPLSVTVVIKRERGRIRLLGKIRVRPWPGMSYVRRKESGAVHAFEDQRALRLL